MDDPTALHRHRLVLELRALGIEDERVLDALEMVPRHCFVESTSTPEAYANRPLSIGHGQTISQPLVVALMTELLALRPEDRVLEIGTGSGYQTAILAELAAHVTTIERVPALHALATRRLEELGYANVRTVLGDGTLGYAPGAPYDAVLVTAASPRPPRPILEQLAEGGRLVLPVGDRVAQELKRVVRRGERYDIEDHGGVRFVPLLGEEGW